MRNLSYLAVFLVLFSCNSNQQKGEEVEDESDPHFSKATQYFESIFSTDLQGVLRGFSFGQTKTEVEAGEEGKLDLIESNDQMTFYEIVLTDDTTGHIDYAEIKYFYDRDFKLDVATVNYYIEDSTCNILLFDLISKAYENKYGHSYVDIDGYTVWSTEGSSNGYDVAMKMKKLLNLNEPGITLEYTQF